MEEKIMEVKTYENIEEMWDELEKQRKLSIEAFNNCSDKQKALKAGDWFITSAFGLVILNEIQALDPEDEREYGTATAMGYVMVKAWSSAIPEGEMGSAHRLQAIFKLQDGKYTKEEIIGYLRTSFSDGELIDNHELGWMVSNKNLEVLVDDSEHD